MDIALRDEGPVAIITWNEGENRVNLDSLARLNSLVDEMEDRTGPLAVVVTGSGKFFSNGLDLERFGADPVEFLATLQEAKRTIGRLLLLPAYSVAAINGHAFAMGSLLTMAFDYRVMREDRGYWCMNEAEIGLALDEQLFSIMSHRLPRATATEAAFTARRYGAPDALASGIIEATAPESEVLTLAISVAERNANLDRRILGRHKILVHGEEAEFLGVTVPS
ncbi:MAG: enoyl-CoA hydratase/isomerase family protein [Acidimicrobiales bacterium]